VFYQNTEKKNREGRKASVWGVEIFSANLSVDGRAKEVNKRTMGHIEISSFSAFDERRSVPRDVIYIYPPKKITKGKMFPSSLT
jgi:hypothetical protein